MALGITLAAAGNSVLSAIQAAVFGARVARVEIEKAPIFVVGHWRTGTTFLHELLALDDRHTYPTTYQCFSPNHFLLTDRLFPLLLRWLVPRTRPMDDLPLGLARPQEDEFAVCIMGVASPYLAIAFPNKPLQFVEYLDLESSSPAAQARWKRAFVCFLRRVALRDRRRLVLKSPLHTSRMKAILELFPAARFVHLVREPRALFGSTIKLWRTLYRLHGLRSVREDALAEQVFRAFERIYERFAEQRDKLDPSHFCELRFEELVHEPIRCVERIYRQLDLGGFDEVRPRLEDFIAGLGDYEASRYAIPPETRSELARRWGWYAKRYGYSVEA
ncbi:MAG: sulfotransferase [Phycisphaerae bacterium]